MDPEQKRMLEKLLDMTTQNNKILRKIQRQAAWSSFFKIFYWAVIIGIAIWSYNIIQPYIEKFSGLMNKVQQIQNINLPK